MPKVTLSFDNGPEPEVTPRVLEVLANHAINASFFVLGRKVATPEGRALAERVSAEGHKIGNHTYSHTKPLGELDRDAALREFMRAEESLKWLRQPERLFRPYGRQGRLGKHLLHPAVADKIIEDKFTLVLWNAVPGDWRDPEGWVARAREQCASQEWSLMVLHDHIAAPMKQLDRFIAELKTSGMQIVQDYPDDCVPIRAGRIVHPIEPWTAARTD